MLVHTAVPEKWDEESLLPEPNFTVVGEPAEKKRKSQYMSRESLDVKPAVILNNQKRKLDDSANDEVLDMIDTDGGPSSHGIVYEEVIIPPNKRSYKCVVVKQKKSKSPPKMPMNYIQPTADSEDNKEETFFLTEEGNISSTNIEKGPEIEEEEVPNVSDYKKSSQAVESYSEFIFNGEIYVQMPKRIFEAEKEKIRAETNKYKASLQRLKKQIDDLLGN